MAFFRRRNAYVLLGDPGAGKTEAFQQEAAATGGHYLRARDFAAFDLERGWAEKTLFIDGLDEMRAGGGDGRTPLDHVRRHLMRLGRPPFRLSCREADWYGDSDRAALLEVTTGADLAVLHLDPLTRDDVAQILEHTHEAADPAGFIRQAEHHQLADLLRNPQTLGLLARAVKDQWPESRAATYELACAQLARDCNSEHQAATRSNAPALDAVLEAAGFLCAVHLLAGLAGFALVDGAADALHAPWRELSPPKTLPLFAALSSGLFQTDEREQQRIPVHRSIAEYLGAQYLAQRIERDGLPIGRVSALMAGSDGGIVPDLRGLAAWLAVHSRAARPELIERDPLGIVLYGDVRNYPTEDKRRVMPALKGEAERYAHFRFQDWNAAPFGALASPDMIPVFLELLASPSREPAHLALLDCALDALQHGPPLVELADAATLSQLDGRLELVLRDESYPFHVRESAAVLLVKESIRRPERLVALTEQFSRGLLKDEDQGLLGHLLTGLYPKHIPPDQIFDHLRPRKDSDRFTTYLGFWGHRLNKMSPDEALPILLDRLAQANRRPEGVEEEFELTRMAGDLLARGLEVHGDRIADTRLYDWLGAGLDAHGHPRIDNNPKERVSAWLSARPDRYKAVLLEGAHRCLGNEHFRYCLIRSAHRLYSATPPSNLAAWYLDQAAAAADVDLARHFFDQAVYQLPRVIEGNWVSEESLDWLEPWLSQHPQFQEQALVHTFCSLDDWRREDAARRRESRVEQKEHLQSWTEHFRNNLVAIREGSAPPKVLHDLAAIHSRLFFEVEGDTPKDRLTSVLGEDQELIQAAYAGLMRSLDRPDLPSVEEIIDLETKGREHYIRLACLVGMDERYRADPTGALQLDDDRLRKVLAFYFTWLARDDAGWYAELVRTRPDLVAGVLTAYALPLLRKGREHVNGLWPLAYDDTQAAVARLAVPALLRGFPLRAKQQLLTNALAPLLKAALRHVAAAELDRILAERLAQTSMSGGQRVYWLASGLIHSPPDYEAPLARHIGDSKARAAQLGGFFHDFPSRPYTLERLPASSHALLIELLAPDGPPDHPRGFHWVTSAMQTSDQVRAFINTLGGDPSPEATQALERLLTLPRLTPWRERLRQAAHAQRIARRKASFRHLDAGEVCRTLAHLQPANAADLAALVYDQLRDLARKIRNGGTNDYRQYWSLDASNTRPARPKPENDCRDALLSDLMERLGRLGVDAIKEGYYADEKRADIRVSFGGAAGFNVPIEIKKDSHHDLWRAIKGQLIERYTRDPGAEGYGIYLVIWFGGQDMPLPQEGKRLRSAGELEERLRQTVSAEERHRIQVLVLDCALPQA
ncbi:MAG: hypothetical protein HZB71_06055 [Betaproteobacteria bacterium]|nr:hypothetical protein [Betaproteobacteria bacterium]